MLYHQTLLNSIGQLSFHVLIVCSHCITFSLGDASLANELIEYINRFEVHQPRSQLADMLFTDIIPLQTFLNEESHRTSTKMENMKSSMMEMVKRLKMYSLILAGFGIGRESKHAFVLTSIDFNITTSSSIRLSDTSLPFWNIAQCRFWGGRLLCEGHIDAWLDLLSTALQLQKWTSDSPAVSSKSSDESIDRFGQIRTDNLSLTGQPSVNVQEVNEASKTAHEGHNSTDGLQPVDQQSNVNSFIFLFDALLESISLTGYNFGQISSPASSVVDLSPSGMTNLSLFQSQSIVVTVLCSFRFSLL